MKKETKVLFVRLPAELHEKITEFARKEGGRSESSVARQAIEEFLEKRKPE